MRLPADLETCDCALDRDPTGVANGDDKERAWVRGKLRRRTKAQPALARQSPDTDDAAADRPCRARSRKQVAAEREMPRGVEPGIRGGARRARMPAQHAIEA